MSSGPPRKRIRQIAGQSSLLAFQTVTPLRKTEETGIYHAGVVVFIQLLK